MRNPMEIRSTHLFLSLQRPVASKTTIRLISIVET